MVSESLHSLSQIVLEQWEKNGRTLESFPEAALYGLRTSAALDHLASAELVNYVLSGGILPYQSQLKSEFAEPNITLHRTNSFYIEVNFWIDSTTTIHQHSFAGAFGVLEGESIHSIWSFETSRAAAPELLLGRVRHQTSELLKPGDTRPIVAGRGFLHSLFHLSRPSATLVLRTDTTVLRSNDRPWTYMRPTVAIDLSAKSQLLVKKLETLRYLRRTDRHFFQSLDTLFGDGHLSAYDAVLLLVDTANDGASAQTCRRLARMAASAYQDLVGRLDDLVDHLLLQRTIVGLRTLVHDDDARLFLALLLLSDNITSLRSIHSDLGFKDSTDFLALQLWRLADNLSQGVSSFSISHTPCGYEILKALFNANTIRETVALLNNTGHNVTRESVCQVYSLIRHNSLLKKLVPPGPTTDCHA